MNNYSAYVNAATTWGVTLLVKLINNRELEFKTKLQDYYNQISYFCTCNMFSVLKQTCTTCDLDRRPADVLQSNAKGHLSLSFKMCAVPVN